MPIRRRAWLPDQVPQTACAAWVETIIEMERLQSGFEALNLSHSGGHPCGPMPSFWVNCDQEDCRNHKYAKHLDQGERPVSHGARLASGDAVCDANNRSIVVIVPAISASLHGVSCDRVYVEFQKRATGLLYQMETGGDGGGPW